MNEKTVKDDLTRLTRLREELAALKAAPLFAKAGPAERVADVSVQLVAEMLGRITRIEFEIANLREDLAARRVGVGDG